MFTKLSAHLILAAIAVAVCAAASFAGNIAPNPQTCEGKPVTILGTPGSDFIVGTAGPDVILGGDGDDTIHGLGGNDVICGGQDDDVIYAGPNNDVAYGGPGNDRLFGMDGFDWLNGQDGDDLVRGGLLSDTLIGEDGSDLLDAVTNDSGHRDDVFGGAGKDRLVTNDGIANDKGSGGPAVDTCMQDAAEALASCEI